jgi:homoserine acetyltransferase
MFLYIYVFYQEILNIKLKTIYKIGLTAMPILIYFDILFMANVYATSFSEEDYIGSNIETHIDILTDYINQHEENTYYIIHQLAQCCSALDKKPYIKYYDFMLDGNIDSKNAVDLIQNAECDYFIVSYNKDDYFWQFNEEAMSLIYSKQLVDIIKDDKGDNAFAIYKNGD